MDYRETIITGSDFTKMGAAETKDYIAHVLCLQGSCSFVYNGERYDLLANNLLIVRQHHLIKDFSHTKTSMLWCFLFTLPLWIRPHLTSILVLEARYY